MICTDTSGVSAQYIAEVAIINSSGSDRIQRILTAILESGLPLPALDLSGGLTPAVLDAMQAAILRVELAKYGRVLA